MTLRSVIRCLAPALVLTGLAGCGLGREKAPTAPGGQPQVSGTVNRAGTALAGFKVKLYDDSAGTQVDSTFTDATGAYGFSGIPAGKWMVKASPPDPGDLGYVRFFLDLATDGQTAVVPPFDVSAHGIALLTPADGATVDRPTFSSPLHFSWNPYQASLSWLNARVADSLDVMAWSSPQGQATSADWNGLGNDGVYAGAPVPAGTYEWRVKLHLGNAVQAATRVRTLILR